VLLGAGAMAPATGWAATQTIELNEIAPSQGPQGAALRYFERTVALETGGRVRVDVQFNGALGGPETSVENMMFDDLQAFAGNLDYYLPLMIDEVSGLETPFLLPGAEPARRYLASPLLDTARTKVLHSRRIRFLQMAALRTPFHIIASRRPISSAADLAGLRITSSKPLTKTAARVWQALGVIYVPALSATAARIVTSGQADAAIFPDLESIEKSHLLGAAPHLIGIDDCPQIWQISLNEAVWTKLDPAEQQALASAARQSASVFETQWTRSFNEQLARLRSKDEITYAELQVTALRRKVHATYIALVAEGSLNPTVLQAADTASRTP
jgi:TRAP-type C4-dicarboxylate transport system substrate-binding protein